MTAAIVTEKLCKTYPAQGGSPAKQALDNVSLTIPRGSIFGLLGPNGAGKSTLINILAGLVNKTSGSASIDGLDIDRQRKASKYRIGIVPQEISMDPFFSPLEALELQAGLYGVPKKQRRNMAILEALGLADKAHVYARTLSGGMRRRLMVAKAMVHQPPILVLDEPTAGVDIELRRQLWSYVRELNNDGVTIVLTTHYLEEAESLCDYIAVINRGTLVANDSKQAMLARVDSKTLTLTLAAPLPDGPIPPALQPYHPERVAPDVLRLVYSRQQTTMGQILADVQAAGLTIADLSTSQARLEDAFLQLVQQAA